MRRRRSQEEFWRRMLAGELPGIRFMKRLHKLIPSEPRCKLCLGRGGLTGSEVLCS